MGYTKSFLYVNTSMGDALHGGTQNPSHIVWEIIGVGYAKFFLYSVGNVLHRGTQNLPYIIWENNLA